MEDIEKILIVRMGKVKIKVSCAGWVFRRCMKRMIEASELSVANEVREAVQKSEAKGMIETGVMSEINEVGEASEKRRATEMK